MRRAAASGRAVTTLLVTVAVLAPGCAAHGLDFRQDTRVHILRPHNDSTVELPVTISWRVGDFNVTGPDDGAGSDAGYFGVFVDRAPQPPGQPLSWFARHDQSCATPAQCITPTYLADRNVYTTTLTQFTITQLPRSTLGSIGGRELHDVTIALLDGQGRRIGESAFYVEFLVKQKSSVV